MTFINFRIPYEFYKSNIFPFHKEKTFDFHSFSKSLTTNSIFTIELICNEQEKREYSPKFPR
jgi:hypothetical protein